MGNLQGPPMRLYWANICPDVRGHVGDCADCAHSQPIKRVGIYKPIISGGPFDRFTAGLYQIPDNMLGASRTNYRYILSCIGHFSKYKWAGLICKKGAATIVKKPELPPNFNRPPVNSQTGNGGEFKNELVGALCARKKIKICHGGPCYPQSQGVIGKLNDLISKSLHASLSAYLKKNNKNDENDNQNQARKKAPKEKKEENDPEHFEPWDLEGSLKAWTTNSNRNLHSVTGMIPLMAINLHNSEEIERVRENTRNYYAKRLGSNHREEKFRVGTKVLIIEDVRRVKSKNQLICTSKNSKKNAKGKKIRIPAEVISVAQLQESKVEINICKSVNDFQLDEKFLINIDYLDIPSDRSWNVIRNH